MVSKFTRTEAARALLIALAWLVALATPALAHEASRMTSREIVRLAGWFGPPPADAAKTVREVKVTVQGKERVLHATDWQVYALAVDQKTPVAPAPESVVLQGNRADLAALAAARPEQRVAILGERRPGHGELFLLAVDLCPAR